MARLLPLDFDLTQLEHSERRTCEAFIAGLDESWYVVPKVPLLVNRKDAEIDIVLASAAHGVLLVEVKGGDVQIDAGTWVQNGRPLKKSPTEQVTAAKHNLVHRMRQIGIELNGLFMAQVIALPDKGAIPPEGMGPDAPQENVFGHYELAAPAAAIARVLREHGPVSIDRFTRFLRALRPDVRLEGADTAVMPVATRRLDDDTRARLGALCTLDSNKRVLVTGGAGSGKTWLVTEWAKRAAARGERTVVITFNRPLADHLRWSLSNTGVRVHTYHDLIVELLQPYGFEVRERPDRDYWEAVPTRELLARRDEVGTPFDTIIIDEGQDMRPHWLASIEMLLDPTAVRPRLLMVADPSQAIYVEGWAEPEQVMIASLDSNLPQCSISCAGGEASRRPRPSA